MLKKIRLYFVKIISALLPNHMAKIAVNGFCTPRRFERTELERACFEQGRHIEFKSGQIANIWGENNHDNQPLILLIHGWESRGTTFYTLIDALVAQGFKVLAWNAPAHGASPGQKTQLYAMVEALIEDLKTSGLKPSAMIGHSMGGAMIGLLHKLTIVPKCLVIISAPTRIRQIFSAKFKSYGMNDRVVKRIFQLINTFGAISMDEFCLSNSDLDVHHSILVVHDKNDREIPFSEFEHLQIKWKNAEFLATIGLGHRRILRDPDLSEKIATYIKHTIL